MRTFVRIAGCVGALWGCAVAAQEDFRPSAERAQGYVEPEREDSPRRHKSSRHADTGLYAQLGGGAEGYTGQLAPRMEAGFAYGAAVGYRPIPFMAVELGFNGSLNDVDIDGNGRGGSLGSGPDVVRSGGQALVVGNFTATRLQPYAVTGLGVDDYNIRHDAQGRIYGFEDDTSGYVPAGLGLRYQVNKLITADARVSYNFLFDQGFAPTSATPNALDGRYMGTLQVGGTY
ncbi:hypothetical protein LXT21_28475 [Myxococcus sp. K38C18041901]|uniref:hypothetical protein n=1 Tax=Myxococcus guangdongensis TaxID=2906760 RepID=UPI0020A7479F|nr:hypothetical protein [Myxococcus guangdongensis]MCP3062727.1 hypothetical protein [Myxococcus guangdongensis]